jgi:hypothetical protein
MDRRLDVDATPMGLRISCEIPRPEYDDDDEDDDDDDDDDEDDEDDDDDDDDDDDKGWVGERSSA